MCECSFQFRLWWGQFWKIVIQCSCFVTRFRQLQFKFVGLSRWARDSNDNFVYWHSFSSKFQSNLSPRCKGPITLDEFEKKYWICSKEWRIWSYIPNSLSDTDEFQWQLTKLNFKFERSKLFRTKLYWKLLILNAEVTNMGGKTYIMTRSLWPACIISNFFRISSTNIKILKNVAFMKRKSFRFQMLQAFK